MNKLTHLLKETQRAADAPNGILCGADDEGSFTVSHLRVVAHSSADRGSISIEGRWTLSDGTQFSGLGAICVETCSALAAFTS